MTEPRFFERSGTDPLPPVPVSIPEAGTMTVIDHLDELRRRLFVVIGSLAVGFGLAFMISLPMISLFQRMAPPTVQFIQITPGEVFLSSLRLSLYLGVALALPVILYQTLRFVMPGLTLRERRWVLGSVLGGTLLFAAGVVFAYYLVIPSALTFLMDYGQSVAVSQISIGHYVAFCASLLVITGAVFELPMVLFLLALTGLVRSRWLVAEWRWAILILFTVAAVVTPSQDPFTMALVGVALTLLYGLSILPIKLIGR